MYVPCPTCMRGGFRLSFEMHPSITTPVLCPVGQAEWLFFLLQDDQTKPNILDPSPNLACKPNPSPPAVLHVPMLTAGSVYCSPRQGFAVSRRSLSRHDDEPLILGTWGETDMSRRAVVQL